MPDERDDYYKRKDRRNAETVEYVVRHWRGIVLVLVALGIVGAFLE